MSEILALGHQNIEAVAYEKDDGETRYKIVDCETGEIVDDAQGYGYKSPQSAVNGYRYKNSPEFANRKTQKKTTGNNNEHIAGDYAFVDGSFNATTGVYGYGGFLCSDVGTFKIQGSGNDSEMAAMRNVAGEIEGALAAIEMADSLGITELVIYYDYVGVEAWPTGIWQTKKKGTVAYAQKVQEYMKHMNIIFRKVKGHSGIPGNEKADELAKEAVGIK